MWQTPAPRPDRWARAVHHLRRCDPVLRRVIAQVGPCTLGPRRDPFIVLVQSIFNQQLSVKGAATLFDRFRGQFPRRRPTPAAVADLLDGGADEALLRWCGLSRQKRGYVLDLARHFADGRLSARGWHDLDDAQCIDRLSRVRGVGRWTAEIFLMFVLNRPDVLPVDDLGLREAVRANYALRKRPDAARLAAIGEPWRPWRTIASWYLWHAREGPSVTPPQPASAGRSRPRSRVR